MGAGGKARRGCREQDKGNGGAYLSGQSRNVGKKKDSADRSAAWPFANCGQGKKEGAASQSYYPKRARKDTPPRNNGKDKGTNAPITRV